MSPSGQASARIDRGAWARRHNHALVSLARRVWQDDCTLENAFALICETAAETLEIERVNIWQHDPGAGLLQCLHHYERSSGRHVLPEEDATLRVGGEYGAALDKVRVINLTAVERDGDDTGLGDYLRRHGISSLLDAPVRSAGELLGVICHEHVGPPRIWTPEDQAFAGSIGDYVAMAYEIDRRRRLEGRVRYLELHDPHTNLPNRDHLLEVVHSALRPMHGGDNGLVAIHLNLDASPHDGDAGHELLVEAATRLRRVLDGAATLARVRGNAFAVLPHRHLHETEALNLAERCIDIVQSHLDQSGTATIVTGGIAFSRDLAAPSADNLLRNAETASQEARNGRHGRCEIFDAEHHRGLVTRLRLERTLREAFEAGQMQVHFQPEVELASGRWVAAEALLRWIDGEGRCRAAQEFVDIIEASGLIVPIGRWMLHEACRLARRWPVGKGIGPKLRVNLSARQFEQASLVADVTDALAESGLQPGRLCLELTESALLPDVAVAAQTLTRLRELGISVALDDFGTGYSSLAYLKRLPIDVLKLDRSFIAGLPDDPYDLAIVQAIAGLARKTGLGIVAEGVETQAQAQALRECGVERGQGYLFSEPVHNEALMRGFAAGGSG
ncbi:sensor domain-containing phosphodiesterase [Luteimonas marina]|uniref:Sensor domain-containing phosphodiesterase n=1 Tax=Luteimonas marina TaxID=488485 RepID=A0A5C5U8U2_9GAMM|nr:sensor domain-containing phosphodiesterase [Luteimonas marina]TWT22353.1 sensor domain-containing phosphodiesterase [Luteimonas marina]